MKIKKNIVEIERVERKNWQSYIENENFEYFVTLTFIRRLSDAESVRAVQFFIKRLISLTPKKSRHLIKGVIVAERTKMNAYFDGHLHFHIALKGVNEYILNPLVWLCNVVSKCALALYNLSGKALCNTASFDIKPIYEICGLASYLAKDIRYPFNDLGDSIWPFSQNGVQYIMPSNS